MRRLFLIGLNKSAPRVWFSDLPTEVNKEHTLFRNRIYKSTL